MFNRQVWNSHAIQRGGRLSPMPRHCEKCSSFSRGTIVPYIDFRISTDVPVRTESNQSVLFPCFDAVGPTRSLWLYESLRRSLHDWTPVLSVYIRNHARKYHRDISAKLLLKLESPHRPYGTQSYHALYPRWTACPVDSGRDGRYQRSHQVRSIGNGSRLLPPRVCQ